MTAPLAPALARVTAETITDEQMSALVMELRRDLDTAAFARLDPDIRPDARRVEILKARARCAELLSERRTRAETDRSITAWANATFGIPATNLSIAYRARRELDELIAKLEADDKHPGAVEEVADVVIVLSRLVVYLNADLLAAVDAKMAINRARKWTLDGNGHGQHVETKEAP